MMAVIAKTRTPQGKKSANWFQMTRRPHLLWFFLCSGFTFLITAAAFAQSAVDFDGRNDYITFGAASILALPQFTIECWFKRNGAGVSTFTGTGGVTAVPLITKGRQEADGSNLDMNYFFGINAADHLTADFEDMATGGNHSVTGTTAIANKVWYHSAAAYDGTTWRIYLNGNLEAESAANATPRFDSIQHAGIATAMSSPGAAEGYFKGVIDEVRIWDYARTQKEISESKDLQITTVHGLVGRWGLNEGSGTAAANSVTGGVKGNLTNGPAWVTGYAFPNLPIQLPSAPSGSRAAATHLAITSTGQTLPATNPALRFSVRSAQDPSRYTPLPGRDRRCLSTRLSPPAPSTAIGCERSTPPAHRTILPRLARPPRMRPLAPFTLTA